MRDANRRFAEALAADDVAAALDADEELHRIPVAALRNRALEAVLEQFEPLVRRAELLRFSGDGRASVERHEQLIELLAAGDAEGAASVNFDIWHSLPAGRRRRSTVADPLTGGIRRCRPRLLAVMAIAVVHHGRTAMSARHNIHKLGIVALVSAALIAVGGRQPGARPRPMTSAGHLPAYRSIQPAAASSPTRTAKR